jgi:hypothetical protein
MQNTVHASGKFALPSMHFNYKVNKRIKIGNNAHLSNFLLAR